MNENEKDLIFTFFMGLMFGMLIGGVICGLAAEDSVRYNAIENNAAHYEVDPKTGDITFVWDGKE